MIDEEPNICGNPKPKANYHSGSLKRSAFLVFLHYLVCRSNMTFWSQELCCPLCQDYFKDPVLLPCSHSFCNACLQTCCSSSRTRVCPLCKNTAPSSTQPTRNLALRNLCEEFRQKVNPNAVCRRHAEMLKLYCHDHGAPICLVCQYSTEHKNHMIVPLEEVAEEARASL